MTTILAVETKNKVTIAFDDKVSGGNTQPDTSVDKVFTNTHAGIVLGVAGLLKVARTLMYAKLPAMKEDDWDVDRYVTMKLLPAIARQVAKYNDADDEYVCDILAVVRGRVYDIGQGTWTRNPSGLYGIGSGGRYALGAYAAGALAGEAVEIASEFDNYTSPNVTVWEITQEG